MTRSTLTIAIAFLCGTAAAAPLVTYESPCECRDNHGKHRWAEKNDPALPPTDASAIQAVAPSDIFSWQGPTEYLVPSSERIWSEQKWYALTGRVVDLRAEEDGDLHIALQDASSDNPGMVVVEISSRRSEKGWQIDSLWINRLTKAQPQRERIRYVVDYNCHLASAVASWLARPHWR